jgi:glycine cleavage system H protein
MNVPRNCRYTRDHFWLRPEGNAAVVGVSDYLQEEMGEVVFIDLPDLDEDVAFQGTFGVIESEESVSDMVAPVSGTVDQINSDLENSPELVNEDPYGEGWLIRILMDDPDEVESLMTPEEYEVYITDLDNEE